MNPTLTHGIYTFTDAAKLTGLRTQRIREWFIGRSSEPNRKPVFHSSYEPIERVNAISFHDLIDVYVAGHLRNAGVSLSTVRKVHVRLAADWQTKNPFARNELLTDGKDVFVRGLDAACETEIYEALTKQKAFPQLLSFFQRIDYDRVSLLAARWQIASGVVVDPGLSFGKPVLECRSIPTYLIAAEYRANDRDAEKVAGWYSISAEEVLSAVQFETSLAA
jgi:uncharacterized protein (DUF433 family)